MKKNSFKKVIASLAALSVVAVGTAAVPVSAKTLEANQTDAEVYVDQVTVSVEEAKAGVPVYVRLNVGDAFVDGMSNFEFGVNVDNRATRSIITAPAKALKEGGELVDLEIKSADSKETGYENFTWISYGNSEDVFYTDEDTGERTTTLNCVLLKVTIDDPIPGETYPVNIETVGVNAAPGRVLTFMNLGTTLTDSVDVVDGWIKIEGEPETTAPETTTEAETTKAEETTTKAEETTTETETSATETETETSTSTTTSTNKGDGTSTSSTTGTDKGKGDGDDKSPETGVSDVLPIAGVAAAVAVLGGVALATKKKND